MKNRLFAIAATFAAIFLAASCGKGTPDTPPEEVKTYEIVSTGSISNLSALAKMADPDGTYYTTILSLNSVKDLVDNHLQLSDQALRTIRFTYKSVDPKGLPVTESAYLAIPEQAFNGTSTLGTIIYNHGTYMSEDECGYEDDILEVLLAWGNYAFLAPDGYGFGASSSNPQAYLNPTVAARSAIDAYNAAMDLLDDLKASCGEKIINAGYSQGGFNAMSVEKYLAEHPETDITISATYAGGGPYNVPGTYDVFLNGGYDDASVFAVSSVISFNECEGLGLPYSSLLQEPLLSNYEEWFLSKKYSKSEIEELAGTTDITKMLASDIIAKTGTSFDALWKVCNSFSLVSGDWYPRKTSELHIYHSTKDEIVPYENMEALKAHFATVPSTGASITFRNMQDVPVPGDLAVILYIVGKGKISHVTGALYFLYDFIANGL